jgi:hypothetical protein
MSRIIDLTGQRFGRLVAKYRVSKPSNQPPSTVTFWVCECDCGNVTEVRRSALQNGFTKSCGCLKRDVAGDGARTHGMSEDPIYNVWRSMRDRCKNPKNKCYSTYGAIGITVCQRWNDSFEAFYADMGQRPSPRHTLERKDSKIHYCPENCSWELPIVQGNNTSRNRRFDWRGNNLTLAQICRSEGKSYAAVQYHLNKRKRSIEDSIQRSSNVPQKRTA